MKKNLSLLAALLMSSSVATGLISCGEEPATPSEKPVVSESTKEEESSQVSDSQLEESSPTAEALGFDFNSDVEIEIYTTLSTSAKYGTTFDHYLEKFQEIYPNIKVTHTRAGGYDDVRDKIKTEIGVVDGGPNLAYCYSDHVALYNKAKAVQSLDKFMNNKEVDENGKLIYGLTDDEKADYIDGYYEEGKGFGDGLMYSLPLYKSTEVLYYNEAVFEELELVAPTHWFKDDAGLTPETSMEYVCEKLKEYDPNSIPLGYDSDANWFITMCEQYGSAYTSATGEHFLFDNETNRSFVEKFQGWYDLGYVTTQKIYGAYTSKLFVNTTDTTTARSFMSIGSSAGATHQAPTDGSFSVGISPIPQVDPANPKAVSQGPNICLFKKTNKQEVIASWLLMRYLTHDVTFQANFSIDSGYVPAIKSVMENEAYLEFLDGADGTADNIAALSAQVCMDQTDAYFTSPAFVGSSDARDAVNGIFAAVFLKNKTLDQAFKDAVADCKANN